MTATVTFDPYASHAPDGVFSVTGEISDTTGLTRVAISESLEGGPEIVIGAAKVNADGTFIYSVTSKTFQQSDLVATAYYSDGVSVQSAVAPFTFYGNSHYTTTSSAGRLETSTRYANDGSSTTAVLAGGQTLHSNFFDTFNNGARPDNTFVFDPGHGSDIVRQFVGNGADHDVLSLKGVDFGNSIAEVLAHTYQFRGVGTVIVDPTSGDTVRLGNVSKAELAVNKNDITFHQ